MSRSVGYAVLALLPGLCAANDFPTQARVEFVLGCMRDMGGQSYDTLYPCVCLIDRIADAMSFTEFAEASVYVQLRTTPGERGGVFRDPEQAASLSQKLEAAIESGQAACFVRRPGPSTGAGRGGASSD
jgi:hypothetical protein